MKHSPALSLRAFTLLETLLYSGLFSIIIIGALTCTFSLVESSGRAQTRADIEIEGEFISDKIAYEVAHATRIVSPDNASATKLDLVTSDGVETVFTFSNNTLMLTRSANDPQALSEAPFSVSSVLFAPLHASSSSTSAISYSFTLSDRTNSGQILSTDFSSTSYVSL